MMTSTAEKTEITNASAILKNAAVQVILGEPTGIVSTAIPRESAAMMNASTRILS